MKIAVLEYFTALPPGGAPAALLAEGRAMREAIAADLSRLPGVEVEVVERQGRFRDAVRRCDAALVTAPEQDGILETLCRAVEKEGRRLLGPSPEAVRLAADKLETLRCLRAVGLRTPETGAIPIASAFHRLRGAPLPFVVKPRDGCGAQGIALVRRRDEIEPALDAARRATRREDVLIQEFVPGEDASVSVLASALKDEGAVRLLALPLARQRVRRGGSFDYLGGEIPWPHPLEEEARAAARAAVLALARRAAGVRGYLGVDLVLGRDGPVVIEVNPRLTTSYIGLRHVIRENLAGLLLDSAAGGPLPPGLSVVGRCRFSAFGRRGGRWPTISAGTSAALT